MSLCLKVLTPQSTSNRVILKESKSNVMYIDPPPQMWNIFPDSRMVFSRSFNARLPGSNSTNKLALSSYEYDDDAPAMPALSAAQSAIEYSFERLEQFKVCRKGQVSTPEKSPVFVPLKYT